MCWFSSEYSPKSPIKYYEENCGRKGLVGVRETWVVVCHLRVWSFVHTKLYDKGLQPRVSNQGRKMRSLAG